MSGAGGIAGSAGSMAQAGAGGSPDAPIGSGGTASPDAPITSGPDAPTTLANGSTCTSNGQCTSTYCIDGVCCDKACTGCSACTLQLNGQQGSAKDGQCLPVVASQAPPTTHTPCATDPASPCGLDGLCDGNGACQHTAGGTRCATPSCSGSTLTSSACDSTSHTCTATNSPCSGSQACASATACNTGSCSSDADCVSGYYCASGTCTKQSGPGVTCSSATECVSGFCVDGVCCNSACTGQCQTCAGSPTGTCTTVASGQPVGTRPACTNAGATCGGTCSGSSGTACYYPGTSQTCGNPSCSSDGTGTVTPACNGSGACNSSATTSCGSSGYCSGGSCTSKENSGKCTSGIECTTGNCAIPTGASSGICCATGDSDSDGICCPSGTSNLNGSGVCCTSSSNAVCSGSCTNTTSDPSNCGGCGKACTGAASCSGGECKCPSGTSACASACCDQSTQYCNTSNTCAAKLGNGFQCQVQTSCTSGNCVGGYCCGSSSCNANSNCTSGQCACNVTQFSCGGCNSWNFESGTTEGWEIAPWSSPADMNTILSLGTSTAYTSPPDTQSLDVSVDIPQGYIGTFVVPLCALNGTANVSNFSLDIYVPASYSCDPDFCWAALFDSSGNVIGYQGLGLYAGQWNTVTSSLGSEAKGAAYFGIQLEPSMPGGWTGQIYVANVVVTPGP